jgi:hypothetical protein
MRKELLAGCSAAAAISHPTLPENYTVPAINGPRLDRLCALSFNPRRSGAPVSFDWRKGNPVRLAF